MQHNHCIIIAYLYGIGGWDTVETLKFGKREESNLNQKPD
jgi:hypothetical protein